MDPEYFTVSATGVMRIRHGVQSEFTTLAEWVREKTLFDLISSINFFKHYLTGRCFRRWHKGVRQKNFNRVRRVIEENLFHAKPTFLPHLQAIAGATDKLRSVNFMYANPNHLYSLQEFADLQMVTREQKARPALEGIVDEVQKVGGACSCACAWLAGLHTALLSPPKYYALSHPSSSARIASPIIASLPRIISDQAILLPPTLPCS